MIKTYFIDIRQFDTKEAYEKALESISSYRRQKIALLKHQKDKKRSLGAAIALNAALETYGLKERIMDYELGKQGKPFFRYYPELHFSLSHSGDYAICSIGQREIGNDIEQIRSGRERVAERFFAKEEVAWMKKAASAQEREERMFRLWTMKESFLKVTGFGMSLSLKDFSILMETDWKNEIIVQQHVNEKVYHMKEYKMPASLPDGITYKISVCSDETDFASDLEQILL